MENKTYLNWVSEKSKTSWWHDSADPSELRDALGMGACGITTNPMLVKATLLTSQNEWKGKINTEELLGMDSSERARYLTFEVVTENAKSIEQLHKLNPHRDGYICAQVDPSLCGSRGEMIAMAKYYNGAGPNIAVKLPATKAGLDVLEELVSIGVTCTATVSFTYPQVIAVAERHLKGLERARKNGIQGGECFAVIMIGRLDDYLREVVTDNNINISEDDIRQAGLAVTKKAYAVYQKRSYKAHLLVAALRGTYHMTELAGADLIVSIRPEYQNILNSSNLPFEELIDKDVPADVIRRLLAVREFKKAYEENGMMEEDFISYGVTQKTLSEFASDGGWKGINDIKFK